MLRFSRALGIVFLFGPLAFAQETWTLTTADFKTTPVTLTSVDAEGFAVSNTQGKSWVVKADEFLDLQRAVPGGQASRFMLYLSGGERLSGEPVAMSGEQVTWRNPTLGEIKLPMRHVRALATPDRTPVEAEQTEDIVLLTNGDVVRGIVSGMTSTNISVKAGGGAPVVVPLATLASVQFARVEKQQDQRRQYQISLNDGSAIFARSLTMHDGQFQLSLNENDERTVVGDKVSGVELMNGPVSWLSGRTPVENVYVPFIGAQQDFAARMNRNVEGKAIEFDNRKFQHGIGVHSYSRLVYQLDGSWAALRTQYALDDDARRGDVTVRIKLDDKIAHEQGNVRAGVLSPVVVLDLAGAKRLTLEVDYGQGLNVQDHLNWIEPALLRTKPAPESLATQPSESAGPATRPAEN